jgi:hypothetical protein
MKSRITIILILLGVFGSTVHAQSNCCNIKPGPVQTSGVVTVTVPPSGDNPGGTYTKSITQTYVIQCINSGSNNSCNTNPPTPNNVVIGSGFGAYSPATNTFVVCNPLFTPSTTQSSSTTSGIFDYNLNGEELPTDHGAPLRVRVARQLGYKSVKYLSRMTVTASMKTIADGRGSSAPAYGYSWYAGI